jgi:hypothetical protein
VLIRIQARFVLEWGGIMNRLSYSGDLPNYEGLI